MRKTIARPRPLTLALLAGALGWGLAPIALVAIAPVAIAADAHAMDRAALCAEAEERYRELYPEGHGEADNVVIVKVYTYNFCPRHVTVKAGTTVRWINIDKRTSHSVWLREAGIDESPRFFPDETWEHTFTEPGAYPYLCGPHWQVHDMTGSVTVTAE